MLDARDVRMDVYLPTPEAGRVRIGAEARIVLDAYPRTSSRRGWSSSRARRSSRRRPWRPVTSATKLMFRIRVRIDPERSVDASASSAAGCPGRLCAGPTRRPLGRLAPPEPAAGCTGSRADPPRRPETRDGAAGSHRRPGRASHPPLRPDRRTRDVTLCDPRRPARGPDRAGRRREVVAARDSRGGPAASGGPRHGADGDIAQARQRAAACPRIAYMPQGLGRNLYASLSVRENVDVFGRLFVQEPAERDRADRRTPGRHGARALRGPPGRKLSGGMPKARPLLRPDPRFPTC